jgi:hypothetical protein
MIILKYSFNDGTTQTIQVSDKMPIELVSCCGNNTTVEILCYRPIEDSKITPMG